jgi:exopolysaccharide production protein ExoQ
MNPELALLLCVVGIAGLFYLDRDPSTHASKFLWLPVIWMWIHGSRPISVWLGMSQVQEAVNGNPIDELFVGALMLIGIFAIFRRRKDEALLLRIGWPIVLYFAFCLFSLLFSDFPGWGFKRWVRSLGELEMVMIVATDPRPVAALRRFLSRVGFILLPASILLDKYFPSLSRYYTPEGRELLGGVTTNKNTLGVLTFLVALGALWQVLSLLADKKQPGRTRRLCAQGALLFAGIDVLIAAQSATSLACFVLGAGLMLIASVPAIRQRPRLLIALVVVLLLSAALSKVLDFQGDVMNAMGRSSDLTGRTKIWAVLPSMNPNPITGAGFETFWVGPRLEYISRQFPEINEAHNGYLEIWLNLGGVGICLVALILAFGLGRAVRAFRRDPAIGGLLTAYIVTSLFYNVSEAGFRMLSPSWFFLLLSILVACQVTSGRKRASVSRREIATKTWPARIAIGTSA